MISIIMSTYNGGRYLEEQLESIVLQDFLDWKLFVFDDGSTDETIEILEKYSEKYINKIYFSKNSKNLGAKASFLNGLKTVLSLNPDSDYFCFSDQDDVWMSDKLSISIEKIKEVEEDKPALVFSDVTLVKNNLEIIAESYFSAQKLDSTRLDLNYLLMENKLVGGSLMFNRALAEEGLKKEIHTDRIRMHDWWFALLATSIGNIARVEKSTELYRQHDKNVVGGDRFSKYLLNRFLNLSYIKKSIEKNTVQAEEFLRIFRQKLSPEEIRLLEDFISLRNENFIRRRLTILKNRFLKTGLIRNIALLIFV